MAKFSLSTIITLVYIFTKILLKEYDLFVHYLVVIGNIIILKLGINRTIICCLYFTRINTINIVLLDKVYLYNFLSSIIDLNNIEMIKHSRLR